MTKEELIAELARLPEVVLTDAPGTFLRHDEAFKNLHAFLRPVADDVVLMAWLLNYSSAEARRVGPGILNFAEAALDRIRGRVTTKLSGLDIGFPQFDHLVALGPDLDASPPFGGARFLIPVTVECGAVNTCEFMGDEALVELRARLRNITIGDIERDIEPAANARHRFDDGSKSRQKFLGVTQQQDLEAYLEKLPKLGGVVEMENYERIGCAFVGKTGQATIEVTVEGNTHSVPLARSLKFLDALLRKGIEAARKEL